MRCDIIIPIYNAYHCLSECIDSVIKNTDLEENGLILINDKSTDKRVSQLLKKYKKEHSIITVLTNKKNLGFVATVNKGMKLSKNDVLLLNSDTVVTKNWLKKIKDCAYSGEMIATVTPLSNNATLASVPKIFEENKLPKGLSIKDIGELVENCSYNDYPELPTAHGFCMYIKREVLSQVGYFDEEAFGKGYGEENDFCFRCFDYGYRHLLCDNTYIYHKESQSFMDRKEELIKSGEMLLEERHPQYIHSLRVWNSNRPIKYIGQNIAFEIGAMEKKENILFLIHDWKNVEENVGGTTLHAYDLIQNMRKKYNFHVLAPEDGIYKLYSYWSETETVIKFPEIINFKEFGFYSSLYREMVEQIVENFSISTVHIHHMKGHYFDIAEIIKKFDLHSIFSLHDYYSVCPRINKIYKGEKYCGTPTKEMCGECIKYSFNIKNNMITNWRNVYIELFKEIKYIIAPSESAKEEILLTHQNLGIKVIGHGIDIHKEESTLSIQDIKNYDIAFIGVVAQHKGLSILEHMVQNAKLKNVKIHLFGIKEGKSVKNSRRFVNHGRYNRNDLPKLLKENNIKLICLFSMWPETYAYTLTESISCGIPVIGIDIGAIGERIKKYGFGWTMALDSTLEEYSEKIIKIFDNPEGYKSVINKLNKYKIKTVKEMSLEYEKIYDEQATSKQALLIEKIEIRNMIRISSRCIDSNSVPDYPDYSWVFSTLKWRIISKLKIPQPIKKLYHRFKGDS